MAARLKPRRLSFPIHRNAAIALLGMTVLAGCSIQRPLTTTHADFSLVGQKAPDFSGTDLNGKPIALRDYAGHPLVMNVWASWCGPCRAEEPGFVRAAKDYKTQGIQFLGIDVRDNINQARIFDDEFKVPYKSIFDQASHLGYAYRIDAPPATIFVDGRERIAYLWVGQLNEGDLRALIKKFLLPPAPG
ncbi:MAG: TlpA family protein disulfide reductase [Candidatus Dormibacteria bacterium]